MGITPPSELTPALRLHQTDTSGADPILNWLAQRRTPFGLAPKRNERPHVNP